MVLAVSDFETSLSVWSIRISLLWMFATLAILIFRRMSHPTWSELARSSWLLGSFFSFLHASLTMGFYHRFDHNLAWEHTANQTQRMMGVSVGVGIYFNYLFVIIWMADALWWVGSPNSYLKRSKILNRIVYGYLLFIAVNGAIVFETGPTRWASIVGFSILLAGYLRKRFS
ncbi:MAG: hypothetical protein AAF939_02305 [Planctomycetota bacterium]